MTQGRIFGRVDDPGYQIEALRETAHAAGLSDAEFTRHQSVNSLAMSVDGIMRYWRKRAGG